MTAPSIRRATLADAAALAELGYRTFAETFLEGFAIPYPADDLAVFVADSYAADAFAATLADPDHAVWVGERGGALLAYASAGPCKLPHPDVQPAHVELHRLYVARAAQGTGLGGALLAEALAWMEARGDGPLWLGVWSGNLKAQKLYAAHGFRKAGEYQFPVGAWRDQEFIFRKDREPSPRPASLTPPLPAARR